LLDDKPALGGKRKAGGLARVICGSAGGCDDAAMPRFRFHLTIGDESLVDAQGVELADLAAVRGHVRNAIADIIGDELAGGRDSVKLAISVSDEAGDQVLETTAILTCRHVF